MTKQDFEMLASAFARIEARNCPELVDKILYSVACTIAADISLGHPRFKRAEFLDACFPLSAARAEARLATTL